MESIGQFVKRKRKENNLRQEELALYAGVSIKFLIDLEKDKKTLRIDKVNDVLKVFNYTLGPLFLGNGNE